MKKLFAFLAVITLLSCSSSDSSDDTPDFDATKLQKIVFGNGEIWNFNEKGLLKEIVIGDIVKAFLYSDDDFLYTIKVTQGDVQIGIDSFFRPGGVISWIGDNPGYYYAEYPDTDHTFFYNVTDPYTEPIRAGIKVNEDGLLERKELFFTDWTGWSDLDIMPIIAYYSEKNMYRCAFNDYDTEENYQFDTHINPLREAILPAARSYAVYGPHVMTGTTNWSLLNSPTSVNNVTQLSFEPGNPQSFSYTYTYNSNNLPVIKTAQAYDSGVTVGATYEFAHYYYQGDTLP